MSEDSFLYYSEQRYCIKTRKNLDKISFYRLCFELFVLWSKRKWKLQRSFQESRRKCKRKNVAKVVAKVSEQPPLSDWKVGQSLILCESSKRLKLACTQNPILSKDENDDRSYEECGWSWSYCWCWLARRLPNALRIKWGVAMAAITQMIMILVAYDDLGGTLYLIIALDLTLKVEKKI